MKKIISLSLSALLLLALTVSGCQQESAQKPELEKTIANRLAMTPEQVSAMADGVQDLDLTSAEGENTIVHVRQSFGNQRELYILYDVTFSEKIDLDVLKDGISPISERLSPEGGERTGTSRMSTMSREGQTITYLSYFECGEQEGWPEGALCFTIDGFQNTRPKDDAQEGDEVEFEKLSEDVHKLSWVPTNAGETIIQDIPGEGDQKAGKVYLTPFSLRLELNETNQPDMESLKQSIQFLYKDGTASSIVSRSSGGGHSEDNGKMTGVNCHWQFIGNIDLSQLEGMEVDGHTLSF
ncbi:MAG: hypothetical protein HFF00_00165 [Ruminiclostridium sp.]|nr:hypothetical protein [Ruminiclostridium sp.]